MSAMMTTFAPLFGLPARYAVGMYFKVPSRGILAYNAVDIGLEIMTNATLSYLIKHNLWKPNPGQVMIVGLSQRIISLTAGIYTSLLMGDPMTLEAAAASSLMADLLSAKVFAISALPQPQT